MAGRGWQIWGIGVIGLWLTASPFIPPFDAEMGSELTIWFVTAGLLQIFLVNGLIAAPAAWERRALALVGLGVLALPWALGFDKTVYAVWNAAGAGGLTFVLAVWNMLDIGPSHAA